MTIGEDQLELPSDEDAKREIATQFEWTKEYLSNVQVESIQQFVKTAPADGDKGFTYKGQRECSSFAAVLR